jgi:hypothetical protein
MRTSTVIKALLAATALTPLLCQAESTFTTGAGTPITAAAHVDFQIAIPKFIFLRVGTGTGTSVGPWATGGGVDLLQWSVNAAQVGNGTPQAPTGGDALGGAAETAAVVANNGTVTLTSKTNGALTDGVVTDTISFTTITTTAAHLNSAVTLAAPALADGVTTTTTLTPVAPSKVIQQDATWSYSYANATVPNAGTYGGVNANNSRVTYTASVP